MDAIIKVIESAIATWDPYTVDQQQRVTQIATAIAQRMGLSPERSMELHVAGSLHDLGKIAVPSEVLYKSGKLTDLEFAIIKNHPQGAYNILRPLEIPGQITQIIMQHHERMNGSGYPHGLDGQEILLEAKILGVADVVDAMCVHRPYRPALGIEKAMEEISRKRGVLYDPEVVDSCLRLYQENSAALLGEVRHITGKPTPALDTLSIGPNPRLQGKEKLGRWNWQRLIDNTPHLLRYVITALIIGGWFIFTVPHS